MSATEFPPAVSFRTRRAIGKHDEDQSVARAFGAKTTPDVFVVARDGTLAYRGAPDADHQDPSQGAAWLRGAVEAVLADRQPDPSETKPVGCSVKWKA